MPSHVVFKFVQHLKIKNIPIKNAKILLLGLTFKENCPDLRNSKIKEVYDKLKNKKCRIDLYDPLAEKKEIKLLFGKKRVSKLKRNTYDAIIICVRHDQFKSMGINFIKSLCKKNHIIFDLKSLFKKKYSNFQL